MAATGSPSVLMDLLQVTSEDPERRDFDGSVFLSAIRISLNCKVS